MIKLRSLINQLFSHHKCWIMLSIATQHYKESYPFQPMCLRLVSKSTIYAIINAIVFHSTMVKTSYNCTFDYKVIESYICNYDLQLILVWMKIKMKNAFLQSILVVFKNRWECGSCNSQCGSWATRHHMASHVISIASIDPSCKYTRK
jgi:hypothetical protein